MIFMTLAGLLTIAAVWIPSYWWSFGFQDHGQRYEWFVEQGNLYVNVFAPNYVAAKIAPTVPWIGGFVMNRARFFPPLFSRPRVVRVGPAHRHLTFPLHLPFLVLTATLAALCVYPLLPNPRQRWRRKRGLCVSCGYDLTGNVSGTCPECGSPSR